ncbi:MAG TPA: hypothetical protein VGM59_09860 [Dongiaceae bacterium]
MSTKPKAPESEKSSKGISHPGMMGDGTEEQNLNERGDPSKRIDKAEVDSTFGKDSKTKK